MGTSAPNCWPGGSHSLVQRNAKPNFSILGQEANISETIMPPSINNVKRAASLTNVPKIRSPCLPGACCAGLLSAIYYSFGWSVVPSLRLRKGTTDDQYRALPLLSLMEAFQAARI